jgi:hypothetical protein
MKLALELSPKVVNNILKDKWGICLFKFAQVFAISPVDIFLQKSKKPFTFPEIKEIKLTLNKMRKDILKGARKIEKLMNKSSEFTIKHLTDNELIKDEGIKEFFNKYLFPREAIALYFEKSRQLGKRGIGLNKKSIVAVGWGNLLSKSGLRKDWQLLGDLYFWFWERLKYFDYYKEWSPVDGIEDHLKIQFHKHRFKGNLEDFLIDNLPVGETGHEKEDMFFLLRLIMYKWADGKIAEREVPKLILNIVTDWFLAGNEGLTIFSPGGSFVDPFFGYIYLYLKKEVRPEVLPLPTEWVRLWEKVNLASKELPYEGTEVGDFFRLATKLYLAKKKDYKKLAPMIIFPDRSYFSANL